MKYFEGHNLYKKFDSIEIQFSLAAERGTMTSIVGPSGAGKSTVLKMIAGLEKIDCWNEGKNKKDKRAGEKNECQIFLDGQEISHLIPQKRNLGMVFQQPALFLNMNVIENISYGLRCRGFSKKEAFEESEKFLEMIGLKDFAKRDPSSLSGGEAQRISLARTLIVKPKLILFDEALSALDAPLRKKLGDEILDLQKKLNFTALMVTHDIEEAKRLSQRIVLLKKGKIICDCPAKDFDESLLE